MHRSIAFNDNEENRAQRPIIKNIVDGIKQAAAAEREKKAAEQRRHDENIRKEQELKDRERSIKQRETSNVVNNIIDSIQEQERRRTVQLEKQRQREQLEQLERKDKELRDREYKLRIQQDQVKRSQWESQRQTFVDDFNSIKNRIESRLSNRTWNIFSENIDSLASELDLLITRYDQNIFQPTSEEQHMRSVLSNFKSSLASMQRWQKQRENVNDMMAKILNKNQQYFPNEIENIIDDLNTCSKIYQEYKTYLNTSEKTNFASIPEMIRFAEKQLNAYKLEQKRQAERSRALKAEQTILYNLSQARQNMSNGRHETALFFLKASVTESHYIVSWNDVSQDLTNKMSAINYSIRILEEQIADFIKRREVISVKKANDIISDALDKSNYPDKTLLERHYLRLQYIISHELRQNWHKFDHDDWPELFDRISQSITNELVPTTFLKRWAPLNWTNAALYLQGSKTIGPKISNMINTWVQIKKPIYLELPVFKENNNDIPVAQIVEKI